MRKLILVTLVGILSLIILMIIKKTPEIPEEKYTITVNVVD